MGLTAVAASVAPPPPEEKRTTPAPPPAQASPNRAGSEVKRVEFAQPRRGRATSRPVKPGQHVVVQVKSEQAGEVTIPRLGLTGNVAPLTPATFDLLAPAAGRYDVMFTAPEGEPARVGTLVVSQ